MILGPVSWLDCLVYLLLLAPQLILHAGLFPTLSHGLQALPFLRTFINPAASNNFDRFALFLHITRQWPLSFHTYDRVQRMSLTSRAVIKLPLSLVYDRCLLGIVQRGRIPFQPLGWFEDIAIRCIRYAFAQIPPKVGRIFFSKNVSLPLLRFRMLRHGYIRSPIHWNEVKKVRYKSKFRNFILINQFQVGFQGLWIIEDQSREPDIVIYYVHGNIP